MTPDPHDLLALAVSTATAAGRLLLGGRPADLRVASTKSSPTDIVTEMDTASERMIVEALRSARPDDGYLGEEGSSFDGTSGVRWIVDPLDGTVNYLYDLPEWAVSIAAEVDGEAVAGVVVAPRLGSTWTAVRGGGAWLDGDPVRVNAGVGLGLALLATGFGYAAHRRAAQGRVVAAVLPQVRDVRRAGSAAIDLCSVACGRLDGYWERGTQRWDIAAGGLVAREAGARTGGLHGAAAGTELAIAAPAPLFDELHDLLAALGADTD